MLQSLNSFLWDTVLLYTLVPLGLWFTVVSRGVQFRHFVHMFSIMRQAFHHSGDQISSFQALALSVAGRVGGGNIVGVAVAISLGGPGAVFWMWVVGLLGMATSFFECSLGQLFKRREGDGFRGGPAFYIQHGLGQRWLAVLFSLLLLLTFGCAFNVLQAFTVAGSLHDSIGMPAWASGLMLTTMLALIIFGGIHRIATVAEFLVPLMAVGYLLLALLVIVLNLGEVPAMFALIVNSAFGLEPAVGGSVGAALMLGVKRGLFSNEAGLGSAPNVAAIAEVSHPASQGIVQAFSVFIDTLLMCSCTAVIILLSDVYVPGQETAGVVLTQNALAEHLGDWGRSFVSLALLLFAFSSMLYNYYLGENSLDFFSRENRRLFTAFRLLTLVLVFWGAQQDLATVFAFADLTMGLLAVVNLAALVLLSPVALRLLRDYDRQRREGGDDAVFDAAIFSDQDIDADAWPLIDDTGGTSRMAH